MMIIDKFKTIAALPTPKQLKLRDIDQKFDALKTAEQIFASIADNYLSPISEIRTPSAYREYLSKHESVAHNEGVRALDVMRNAALLKDFVGRFNMLPENVDATSQFHLRESLESAIVHMNTGLSSDIEMDAEYPSKQGVLHIHKGNTTASLPFYMSYQPATAFDIDDSPVDIELGAMQLSPDIQHKFPHLSAKLNSVIVANTGDHVALVIDDDFSIQAREIDDMLFLNHLSGDKGVINELTRFFDKQELNRESNKNMDKSIGLN